MRITTAMTAALADEITRRPEERASLVARFAALWGCHASTVRRRLAQDHGFGDDAASKQDATSYVSDTDAQAIARLIATSIRKGRTGLPIGEAIEIAWRNDLLGSERMPTVATMSRRLRELEISPERLVAPTPHQTVASEHPGHIQQLDASLCIQWKFGARGLEHKFVDLNKLDRVRSVRSAVHRWVLADHCSGAFVVQYYDSPGERIEDMLKFLFWSWSQKPDPRVPFCGLPRVLYTDRGSAFTSSALRHLAEAYDIELKHHATGNARATGSVEVSHWVFERYFESKLRLQKLSSVEELIERAQLEALRVNTVKTHSRHGMTRYDAWQQGVPQPVRVPVEDWEQFCWLATGRESEATVMGDNTISVNGQRYRITGAPMRSKLKIKPHPFTKGMVRAFHQGAELAVVSLESGAWGFPADAIRAGEQRAALPLTPAQKILESAHELPTLRAFVTDEEFPVETWARPAVDVVAARIPETVPAAALLDRVEAKLWVAEQLGRGLTREEGAWFNAALGDEIAQADLEQLWDQFRGQAVAA